MATALLVPAGAAIAEPIVVHREGSVGRGGCGAWYDSGWYVYDPSTGYTVVRAPSGGADFADCI